MKHNLSAQLEKLGEKMQPDASALASAKKSMLAAIANVPPGGLPAPHSGFSISLGVQHILLIVFSVIAVVVSIALLVFGGVKEDVSKEIVPEKSFEELVVPLEGESEDETSSNSAEEDGSNETQPEASAPEATSVFPTNPVTTLVGLEPADITSDQKEEMNTGNVEGISTTTETTDPPRKRVFVSGGGRDSSSDEEEQNTGTSTDQTGNTDHGTSTDDVGDTDTGTTTDDTSDDNGDDPSDNQDDQGDDDSSDDSGDEPSDTDDPTDDTDDGPTDGDGNGEDDDAGGRRHPNRDMPEGDIGMPSNEEREKGERDSRTR